MYIQTVMYHILSVSKIYIWSDLHAHDDPSENFN